MNKPMKIVMMVIVVIFVILYISHRALNPTTSNSDDLGLSKEQAEKLQLYKVRFERNAFHLEKALESISELESILSSDSSIENYEDAETNLKVLHHRTNTHLRAIIESLKNYEEFPNLSQIDILEDAIARLRIIDQEVLSDSLNHDDIQSAFLYTLNALAKADLSISKVAYRTKQDSLFNLAVKQSQLHIKSALLMDFTSQPHGESFHDIDELAFEELDSLVKSDGVSISAIDDQISHISDELDSLLQLLDLDYPLSEK